MSDNELKRLARSLARQCRHVIDGCIYDFEKKEVTEQFADIIIKGLLIERGKSYDPGNDQRTTATRREDA